MIMPTEIYALIGRIMRMVGHQKAADLRMIFASPAHELWNVWIMIAKNPDEVLYTLHDLIEQVTIRVRQALVGLNIMKAIPQSDDAFGGIIFNEARQTVQAVARVIGRQRHMTIHLQEAGFLKMEIGHAERIVI